MRLTRDAVTVSEFSALEPTWLQLLTGDYVCRATTKDYRLDTPSARAFLGQFVALP